MRRIAGLVLGLGGCLTEAGFPDAVSDELCAREEACDAEAFRVLFSTDDVCRDTVQEQMERFLVQSEGLECAWSRSRAEDCLDAIEEAPCEGFDRIALLTGCAAAWGCAD